MYFDIDPPRSEYNKQKNEWSIKIKVEADKVNYSEGCSYMFRFTCFHEKNNQKTELFRKFSSPFKCTSKALLDKNLKEKIITMVHNNSNHSGLAKHCHICSDVPFQDYSKRLRDMHHLIASNMEVSTFDYNRNELAKCSLIEMKVGTIQLATLKDYIIVFFNFSTYDPLDFKDYFNNGTKSVQDIIASRIIATKTNNQSIQNQTEEDIEEEDDGEDIREEDFIENETESSNQQQELQIYGLNFDEFNLFGCEPNYHSNGSLDPFSSMLDIRDASNCENNINQDQSNNSILFNETDIIAPALSPFPQNDQSFNLSNNDYGTSNNYHLFNENAIQNDPSSQNNQPLNLKNENNEISNDDYCLFNETPIQNNQLSELNNSEIDEEADNLFNQFDLNQNNSFEYDQPIKEHPQITISTKKNIQIETRKSPNTPTDGGSVEFNRLVNNLSKSSVKNKECVLKNKVKKKKIPNPWIKLVKKFKKK